MEKRLPNIVRFALRVLRDFFFRNHGLLLTAAVANNMLLSLIPLSAVLMVGFSHFIEPTKLMESISIEVSLIAPGFAPTLSEVLTGFLRTREVIGWVGLGSLLFFSSLAFRVMEDAIFIIFHRPLPTLKRKFWVSALIPYFFITMVAVGLIAITAINAVIDVDNQRHGWNWVEILLHQHVNQIVYLVGVASLVLLFTLFYKVMPVARISFRRALAGGLTATILWEGARHLLVAYYTNISIVNVLYGSMATIVVVLLIMEAVALILLLGAQVIADLQASGNAGIPWHEEPSETNHSPVGP